MRDQSVSPSLDKEGAGGWLRLLQPNIQTTSIPSLAKEGKLYVIVIFEAESQRRRELRGKKNPCNKNNDSRSHFEAASSFCFRSVSPCFKEDCVLSTATLRTMLPLTPVKPCCMDPLRVIR